MLNVFRRGGAAQILITAIASLIIIAFVVEFRAGGRTSASLKRECAVRVGDYCVDAKEFDAARNLAVPSGTDGKALRELHLNRALVDGLVERELLVNEAEKLGLSIGNDETDDELEAGRVRVPFPADRVDMLSNRLGLCPIVPNPMMPNPDLARRMASCEEDGPRAIRLINVKSVKTGRFDYKIYEHAVRMTTNRSAKEFKEMQRREQVAERVRELVRSNVRVSEGEVWLTYEQNNSKAVANSVAIHRDWFAKFVVDTSDAQVEDWAKTNAEPIKAGWEAEKESWTAGCPLVSEILVSTDSRATDLEKQAQHQKIDSAAQRLAGGEDFATVARQISDGRTAEIGGRLGCLSAKSYGVGADRLLEAIKDLKPGAVTAVVETTRGLHLIKLLGQLAEGDIEKEGKLQVARDLAVRFRADAAVRDFATQLIEKVKAGAKLEEAADTLVRSLLAAHAPAAGNTPVATPSWPGLDSPDRPKFEVSMPFPRSGSPIRGAKSGALVAAKLFEMDKPGLLASPVDLNDGLAVVELKEKTLAQRAGFDKEKAVLTAERTRMKAAESLISFVRQLRTAAEKRITIDERYLQEAAAKGAEHGQGNGSDGE